MPEPGQRAHRRMGDMIRDKYRLDAFLASGSMANVYAATHRNGSRVALKILHRELARDPQMAERFRREGYFANAIGHPGVVRAIDDDVTEDGCAFVVLELLEGETLEERRTRLGGKLPLADALQVGDAMLDVLAAAHAHEVLHRDVKPENVFLTKKGEVKLLDFGVARFNDGRASSDMTSAGMVLGTPAFMPPEQAFGRREEVDARSDIWGVGATLFTCIVGEAVHVGGDTKTKSIVTARTPARPLRDVAPGVPRAVSSVIDRALAFEKVERWADANAMREALRWARMSLDDGRGSAPDVGGATASAPPAPAPKRTDEEPTLALRSPVELLEESRRKPSPLDTLPTRLHVPVSPAFPPAPAPLLAHGDGPTLARRSDAPVPGWRGDEAGPSSRDDVFTSAPPVTERGEPAPSSEPTIGLDRDWPPDSSHTELPTTPRSDRPGASVAPGAPVTERIPGGLDAPRGVHRAGPPPAAPSTRPDAAPGLVTAERPMAATLERPVLPQPETLLVPDAGEIFRAALARAEGLETAGLTPAAAGGARLDATLAMTGDLAPRAVSPKTLAGVGALAPNGDPRSNPPPAGPSYPPAAAASYPPAYAMAAPGPYPSAPPAGFGAPGPGSAMSPEERRQRAARTAPPPGPLLSTIAPPKQGALKRNAILALAAIATVGVTYALVAGGADDRSRATATASTAPSTSTVAAALDAGAAPAASGGASPASTVPPIAAATIAPPPTATAVASAPAAPAATPPPKRKPRPRPKPTATAIAATAAPATATATEATPTETATATAAPKPPPTPDDTLPRKDDPE